MPTQASQNHHNQQAYFQSHHAHQPQQHNAQQQYGQTYSQQYGQQYPQNYSQQYAPPYAQPYVQPYGAGQFAQGHYATQPYAQPPSGYEQNYYGQHQNGYPAAKRHKTSHVTATTVHQQPHHFPPPPPPPIPAATYPYPQNPNVPAPPYQTTHPVPPPPPPLPGYAPPPPGWRGPPPPAASPPYPPLYQGPSPAPRVQSVHQQPHAYQQPPTSLAQASTQARTVQQFPRSIQWKAPGYKSRPSASTAKSVTPEKRDATTGTQQSPQHDRTSASRERSGAQESPVPDVKKEKPTAHSPSPEDDWFWEPKEYYSPTDTLDANLSLGEIVWTAPERVETVLPATWLQYMREVELIAEFKKGKASAGDAAAEEEQKDLPISLHLRESIFEEMCYPVQESGQWPTVQDDPAFRDLASDSTLVPIEEVIANRARPATSMSLDTSDVDMEEGEISKARPERKWNVMDNLETALNYGPSPSRDIQSPQDENPQSAETLVAQLNAALQAKVVEQSDAQSAGDEGADNKSGEVDDSDADDAYSPPWIDPQEDAKSPDSELTPQSTLPIKHEEFSAEQGADYLPFAKRSPPQADPSPPGKNRDHDLEMPNNHDKGPTLTQPKEQPVVKNEPLAQDEVKKSIRHALPAKPVTATTIPVLSHHVAETKVEKAQEDALAKLGVTGVSKPVYRMPPPAVGVSVINRTHASPKEPQDGPTNGALPPPPPPPPPPPDSPTVTADRDDGDPWSAVFGGRRGRDSPRSDTSQHTLAGSDFANGEDRTASQVADSQDVAASALIMSSETKEEIEVDASQPYLAVKNRTRKRKVLVGPGESAEEAKKPKEEPVTPTKSRPTRVAAAYKRRW